MIEKQLIRCTRCNALALFSSMDQSPEYYKSQGKWVVLERDDQALFLQAHRGHRLEPLHVIEDSLISHQDYGEPVGISYFEATNGKQRFVVKRFRKSVFDSQRYELIPGNLRFTPTELHVDGRAIQRELERVFSPFHLTSKKIRHFVKQLESFVSHLTPGELKRSPFESHNPSLWCFTLGKGILEKALKNSSEFLTRRERERLNGFVLNDLQDDLFMAMAKVEFQIDTRQEDKKSTIMESEHRRLISEPSSL